MFTLTVIVFDVVILIWAGFKILKKSEREAYPLIKFLVWGLWMSAFGIFMYGVRSIVLQFEPREAMLTMDSIIYNIGTMVHFSGCVLLTWFVYKGFAPKLFTKITAPVVLGLLSLNAVGTGFFPHIVRAHYAPLEPFRFFMTSRPYEWPWMNSVLMYGFFLGSAVIFGIFLYKALSAENGKKALGLGISVPVLTHFGIAGISKPGALPISNEVYLGMILVGLILLILAILISRDKRIIGKAIMYGLGVSLLLSSAIACIFISPIFARIGYGIGAFLTYKAFRMKVE